MRKIIAALHVSLDGFIEGPQGELDWVESWDDPFDLGPRIDTCILGGGMYPGYEQYWLAILANPEGVLPVSGKVPSPGEIAFAQFADKTPHVVLSTTLEKVAWKTARIVRSVDDIRRMKEQPGKAMYAVGGATLVASLMNLGLVDELQLMVHPLVLGGGKALFRDVTQRHALELLDAHPCKAGMVSLTYSTRSEAALSNG